MRHFVVIKDPMQQHIGPRKQVQTTSMDEANIIFQDWCNDHGIDYSFPALVKTLQHENHAEFSVGGVGHDYRITLIVTL